MSFSATDTRIAAASWATRRMEVLVPQLVDVRRKMARLQAEEAQLLAQARRIATDWADDDERNGSSTAEIPHRSVAAEIATAWRMSDRTVQRQIDDASALVDDYPATLAALESGYISAAHARVIVAAGGVIDHSELRREYEQSVLEFAGSESASRTAPIAKRRAEWYAGSTIDERHRRARLRRRVWVDDLDDAMSEVRWLGPAVIAHGVFDRLTQLGREHIDSRESAGHSASTTSSSTDDDEPDRRTLDEMRADIFADLLLATDPVAHNNGPTGARAIRATVQITVPVLALVGDAAMSPFESPTLQGIGPIDAETARILTAGAPGVDRILTHPVTGAVLAVDRYRPNEDLRRHLSVRDEHCRFPGCRMSVRRCDVDHTIDHALGGPTSAENLAHLCRRHHTLKHQTAWTVRRRPGGLLEWTSPTGRVYIDRPVSTVAFAPDPECDLPPF